MNETQCMTTLNGGIILISNNNAGAKKRSMKINLHQKIYELSLILTIKSIIKLTMCIALLETHRET